MYLIMYHYVRSIRNSRYPEIKGLELALFRKQIEFLKQNGFTFITLDEVLNAFPPDGISHKTFRERGLPHTHPLQVGDASPDKRVLLTFDDGYIDHYLNVFPILEQNNIQGFFSMPGKIVREKKVLDVNKIHFILASGEIGAIKKRLFERLDYYRGREYTYPSNEELYEKLAVANRFDGKDVIFIKRTLQVGLPERLRNIITDELFREFVTAQESAFVDELYMNLDQAKTMARHGMVFGIHGYDHYWQNHLTEGALQTDLTQALDVFDGIVPLRGWVNCYPYGSYSESVIRISRALGASAGFSSDVAVFHPESDDPFKIPRLDTNDFPPKSNNWEQL